MNLVAAVARRLVRPFSWTPRRLALYALAAATLVAAPVLRADDEDDGDDAGGAAQLLIKPAGPATQPTTKPATRPANLSPELNAELDAIRDAYAKVESLKLAGTIRLDLDVNGEQKQYAATFESTFQSPNRFRHGSREGDGAGATDDVQTGSTGEKLYVFNPVKNRYVTAEAPKGRVPAGKLHKEVATILSSQNPSLVLALAEDASAELLDKVKTIEKAADVTIDGTAYTALTLTGATGSTATALFDPKTRLLRRLTVDSRKPLEAKGADAKKVELTVDYATTDVAVAGVKPEQFAWAPPEGAREQAAPTIALAGGDDGEGGDSVASAMEGKPAPDFSLKDAEGKAVALSDLKGSVVVLDFWATWCGPCRASLPHLDKIYNDHKGAGVRAFAVNLREDEDKVQKFVDQTKLAMPVLFDTNGKVAEQYGVSGIPQTVVIAKDGTIKKVVVGSGTHDAVRKAVEESMK